MISTNLASAVLWTFPSIVFFLIMSSISIILLRIFLGPTLSEIGARDILRGTLYLIIFVLIVVMFQAASLSDGATSFSVAAYVCLFLVATFLVPIIVILKFFSRAKIHWFVASSVLVALVLLLFSDLNSGPSFNSGLIRWIRTLPELLLYLVPSVIAFAWGARLRF